jgi:hypothetical protein
MTASSRRILDRLSEFEETDNGLWEGQDPRAAISTQAAYTYANAVYGEWRDIIEELQGELEEMQGVIECAASEGPEDYDADATEEAVTLAGERYIRLYFVLSSMEDADHGGMVGAARRAACEGEFTAALVLADAVQGGDDKYGESKANAIRNAVK